MPCDIEFKSIVTLLLTIYLFSIFFYIPPLAFIIILICKYLHNILIKFEYHFLLCYYNKVCSNIIQIRKTDYMEIIYYYETEKC